MARRMASFGVLVVICASAVVLASVWADDKTPGAARGGEMVSSGLDGFLKVEDPVPLKGPFPAVQRKARVGDKVLLQISYDERTENVKTVTAKVTNRAMSALEVINSHHQLFLLKDGDEAKGKPGWYFAVLLKANSPGNCEVIVSGELADGTKKEVSFKFEIK